LPTAYTILEHASLARHNTLRIAATARWLVTLFDVAELEPLLARPELAGLPCLVLGEGSNVLLTADYPGVVLRIAAAGARIEARPDDAATVVAEAGVNWDTLVDSTLRAGWPGLENLALIPGLVGAAPIQNIGAYGVELDELVASVTAWDRATGTVRVLSRADCAFGYRDSRFKREIDRWIVTHVALTLPRNRELRLDYAGVREELAAMGATAPTPLAVAAAVRRIRRRKLPDPAEIGNVGSFFKNPVVPAAVASALAADHPGLPVYATGVPGSSKLSAAWLIDACGWRGSRIGDAGVADRHALVLVNHGAATGTELLELARRIAASVAERFGIRLEPEPRIVGAEF
jgi:UDP-N-acetylmuramate dehydrogenase